MARATDKSSARHKFVCPACKKEFFSYSLALVQQCPRCGRKVHTRSSRLALRIVSILLLLALVLAFVVAFKLSQTH